MPDDPAPAFCPTCGAALDATATEGGCAACLLGDAMCEPGKSGELGSIGGHELVELIARGGMGVVYRARQSDPAREVALKALLGAELMSAEARQRFRIEARAMAKLEHPAILPIYELGEESETPFFTMKLAAGGSLAERMGGYAGRWREIAELTARITGAVQFAHERGVLHRDLKPGNILFDEGGQAFVCDFGLAKLVGDVSDLTRTLALMGTPNYMAPEMAARNGGATTTSDVWSLGVILYELLAGRLPFGGENIPAVLRAAAEDEAAAFSRDVPRDLAVITFKAPQKKSAQRYGSARELADDLQRWLRGEAIHARPTPLLEHAVLWARRHPGLAGMAAVLFLVLASSSFLLLRMNRRLVYSKEETVVRLHTALINEAESLLAGQDLGARDRALEVVRQLVGSGDATLEVRNLAARALATLGTHEVKKFSSGFVNGASSLAYTSDLGQFATGTGVEQKTGKSAPGFLLMSTVAGATWQKLDAPAAGTTFRYSRDGQWLAARLHDQSLVVRKLSAPEKDVFTVRGTKDHKQLQLDFHPDGTHWIYSTGDAVLRRHQTDAVGHDADAIMFTAPANITGLTFSPDGTHLAVQWLTGWGVLDLASAKLLWQRDEVPTTRWPVWHPSGGRVAAGVQEGHRMMLVTASSGAVAATFAQHQSDILMAAFHPTLPLLGTVARDRQLILWDAISALPMARHAAYPRGLQFSADGMQLAFSPGYFGTSIHEVGISKVCRQWEGTFAAGAAVFCIDLSPDGRWLVTNTLGVTRLWDTETRRQAGELLFPAVGRSSSCYWRSDVELVGGDSRASRDTGFDVLRFSPVVPGDTAPRVLIGQTHVGDGGYPAFRTSDRRSVIYLASDGSATVRDSDGSVRVQVPAWGQYFVADISADDRLAACRLDGGDRYAVFQIADGKEVFSTRVKRFARLRFSPDGRLLTLSAQHQTIVWETDSWRELARWAVDMTHEGLGWSDFSPDGTMLAVCSGENRIQLRDTRTWQPLVDLRAPGPAKSQQRLGAHGVVARQRPPHRVRARASRA